MFYCLVALSTPVLQSDSFSASQGRPEVEQRQRMPGRRTQVMFTVCTSLGLPLVPPNIVGLDRDAQVCNLHVPLLIALSKGSTRHSWCKGVAYIWRVISVAYVAFKRFGHPGHPHLHGLMLVEDSPAMHASTVRLLCLSLIGMSDALIYLHHTTLWELHPDYKLSHS